MNDPLSEGIPQFKDNYSIEPMKVLADRVAKRDKKKADDENSIKDSLKTIINLETNGYIPHQIELQAERDKIIQDVTQFGVTHKRGFENYNPRDASQVKSFSDIMSKIGRYKQLVLSSKAIQEQVKSVGAKLNSGKEWDEDTVKEFQDKIATASLSQSSNYLLTNPMPDIGLAYNDWAEKATLFGKNVGDDLTVIEQGQKTTYDKTVKQDRLNKAVYAFSQSSEGKYGRKQLAKQGLSSEDIDKTISEQVANGFKTVHKELYDEPKTSSSGGNQKPIGGYNKGEVTRNVAQEVKDPKGKTITETDTVYEYEDLNGNKKTYTVGNEEWKQLDAKAKENIIKNGKLIAEKGKPKTKTVEEKTFGSLSFSQQIFTGRANTKWVNAKTGKSIGNLVGNIGLKGTEIIPNRQKDIDGHTKYVPSFLAQAEGQTADILVPFEEVPKNILNRIDGIEDFLKDLDEKNANDPNVDVTTNYLDMYKNGAAEKSEPKSKTVKKKEQTPTTITGKKTGKSWTPR